MPQFFHLYNSNKNGVGINGLLRELTHMTWYKGADFLSLSQLSLEWGLLGIQCFFFAGGCTPKCPLVFKARSMAMRSWVFLISLIHIPPLQCGTTNTGLTIDFFFPYKLPYSGNPKFIFIEHFKALS